MGQLAVRGARGEMGLLTQHETGTGRLCRSLHLQASADGKSVLLVDVNERKPGTRREHRFEITIGELIAAIRAHGAELPGEKHVQTVDAA